MNEHRKQPKVICVKDEVYVLGGLRYPFYNLEKNDYICSAEKYSASTNTWEIVDNMFVQDDSFGACSFMDSVYVIEGSSNRCMKFNEEAQKWMIC